MKSYVSKMLWCFFAVLLMVSCGFGLIMTERGGNWPKNWPDELESLRDNATTGSFRAGARAIYYYIEFDNREQFERAWPCLLQLKSAGAPLSLMSIDPPKTDPNDKRVRYTKPTAVLVCPVTGTYTKRPDGSYSHYAEWTEDIKSQLTDGVLPQFVGQDKITGDWMAIKNANDPNTIRAYGFLEQARVEVRLYADGKVIDMNRIRLPKDTAIQDRRKLDGQD